MMPRAEAIPGQLSLAHLAELARKRSTPAVSLSRFLAMLGMKPNERFFGYRESEEIEHDLNAWHAEWSKQGRPEQMDANELWLTLQGQCPNFSNVLADYRLSTLGLIGEAFDFGQKKKVTVVETGRIFSWCENDGGGV